MSHEIPRSEVCVLGPWDVEDDIPGSERLCLKGKGLDKKSRSAIQ